LWWNLFYKFYGTSLHFLNKKMIGRRDAQQCTSIGPFAGHTFVVLDAGEGPPFVHVENLDLLETRAPGERNDGHRNDVIASIDTARANPTIPRKRPYD
jgi:hypothetical protein